MAYRITFVLDLFKGPEQQALSHKVLQLMLDNLFQVDCAYLEANPNTPLIYTKNLITKKHNLHYEQEEAGREDWQDIPTVLANGEGDCEDLACWRAAELVVREKIAARPTFTFKPRRNGGMLYHIVVRHPDGKIEDPSKQLGM